MKKIILFILSFALWCLLTWVPDRQELLVGGLMAILVAILFSEVFTAEIRKLFQIKRYLCFIYYIPIFIWACIKANFDVAYRVLHPKMPINPGIVKIKTNLKTEGGLTLLANSITLTPGTMTIDVKEGYLYIHWINVETEEIEKATKIISGWCEPIIKEICE